MITSVLIRYKLDQITYEWIKKETSDFYICILWQSGGRIYHKSENPYSHVYLKVRRYLLTFERKSQKCNNSISRLRNNL